ncbi:MAG TPA: hypothetical protein VH681_03770 [Nitrospiraceae bacterium]|jgi:hypothetical protein
MIYLKSLVFGIAAALAASVIWLLITLLFPLHIRLYLFSVPGWTISGIVAVAILGFVLGFYWGVRRSRRTSHLIFM